MFGRTYILQEESLFLSIFFWEKLDNQHACRFNEVMSEIGSTKSTFDEGNNMILKHIDDASVVDEKLEGGTKRILELHHME
jgi:hypothetical protein